MTRFWLLTAICYLGALLFAWEGLALTGQRTGWWRLPTITEVVWEQRHRWWVAAVVAVLLAVGFGFLTWATHHLLVEGPFE